MRSTNQLLSSPERTAELAGRLSRRCSSAASAGCTPPRATCRPSNRWRASTAAESARSSSTSRRRRRARRGRRGQGCQFAHQQCRGGDDRRSRRHADRAIRDNMETNFFGVLNVTNAFLPGLEQRKGAIVNMLTLVALASMPMLAAYNASKAAGWSLTQTLRADLAKRGVSVLQRVSRRGRHRHDPRVPNAEDAGDRGGARDPRRHRSRRGRHLPRPHGATALRGLAPRPQGGGATVRVDVRPGTDHAGRSNDHRDVRSMAATRSSGTRA